MTIRERLEQLCRDNGLWPEEAMAVLDEVIAATEEMELRRWEEDLVGYPPQMLGTLWLITKQHALKWIDANRPKHWARPMFLSDD